MKNREFYLPPEFSKDRIVDITNSALKLGNLNVGLFFDKYILWERSDEIKCGIKAQFELLSRIYENPQEAKNFLNNKDQKKSSSRLSYHLDLHYFPYKYYELYEKRLEYITENMEEEGYYVEYLPNKNSGIPLRWRLVINLGKSSVYETSYIFHRNYSIPYIPGSAVKGVTRHWAIQKFSEYEDLNKLEKSIENEDENEENLNLKVEDITFHDLIKIFGSKKEKGNVIFFDAFPFFDDKDKTNKINVSVIDVMSVHYRSYYQSGDIPGDWDNPTPIFFLAIEKGVKFRFALASKNKDLVIKTKTLLKEAITKFGLGAKSSAGYGYFEV